MKNFLTDAFVGLAIIGDSIGFTESSMRAKANIVMDRSDLELKCAFVLANKKDCS